MSLSTVGFTAPESTGHFLGPSLVSPSLNSLPTCRVPGSGSTDDLCPTLAALGLTETCNPVDRPYAIAPSSTTDWSNQGGSGKAVSSATSTEVHPVVADSPDVNLEEYSGKREETGELPTKQLQEADVPAGLPDSNQDRSTWKEARRGAIYGFGGLAVPGAIGYLAARIANA
jgi:hypothetical protein